MRIVKINYLPLRAFWLIWIIVLLIRWLGVVGYKEISFQTILTITLFLVFSSLGYLLGVAGPRKTNIIHGNKNLHLSHQRLHVFFLFITILYIVIHFLDFMSGLKKFGLDFSFHSITLLRMSEARGDEPTGTSLGLISSALSGAPILLLIHFFLNNKILIPKKFWIFWLVILLSALTFLLSGGRFAITIFLMVFLYLNSFSKNGLVNNRFFLSRRFIIFFTTALLIVFSLMSVQRLDNTFELKSDKLQYLKNTLGVEAAITFSGNSLLDNSMIAYVIFEYYLSHSINELDKTINYVEVNEPKYGSYEFNNFTLLLKKLGFDFKNIDELLRDFPSKGKYFTLPGALAVDFGLFFMFPATLIMGIGWGYAWKNFLSTKTFYYLALFLMLQVIFLLSPIVGIIGLNIFPSLILLFVITLVFRRLILLKIRL